jgi:hypothetical protein
MKRLMIIIGIILLLYIPAYAASIQISWSANTETDLAGYKLYSGTASGVYGDPVDVGNVTSHALTLSPAVGTTYYFAVTAYDTSGNESGFSSEASVFIKDGQPPAAPKGIIAKIIAAIAAWLKGIFGAA